MRKVSESDKKLIASLVTSGQSIEYIKDKYKVAERQINSYVKKYADDESFLVSSTKKTHADEETIKIWKREFEGYNKPSNTNDSKNDESYLKQAIEIDAIAFAYRQMKELFDVEVKIPEEIKENVGTRVLKISNRI